MIHLIAIDAGGTETRATLFDHQCNPVKSCTAGPANPAAYGVSRSALTIARLIDVLSPGTTIQRVIAAVSGAGDPSVQRELARNILGAVRCAELVVTDDLRPILLGNAPNEPAALVIAGTGSSVLTSGPGRQIRLFGGRGRIVGDDGSAYQLVVSALRAIADALDGMGPATAMDSRILRRLNTSSFREVVQWIEQAAKADIASLASEVIDAAHDGDVVAGSCVSGQALKLARVVRAAYTQAGLDVAAPLFVQGGLLRQSGTYRSHFENQLARLLPGVRAVVPEFSGTSAIARYALLEQFAGDHGVTVVQERVAETQMLSPTECQPEHAPALDRLEPTDIVAAMSDADEEAVAAVRNAAADIAWAIGRARDALNQGGRLIYIGAGTSGRLGVLDASECPPTFGISTDRVLAIIAGGDAALRCAIEGAEDDRAQAQRDIAAIAPRVDARDLVVGLAASGTTPYTIAALEYARKAGTSTALLCCNPNASADVDRVICLSTGPEVLPGSTRLKAGTATKLALNMISTGALALAGYVYEGLMVGVKPTNDKLKRRAVRIVCALTSADESAARHMLEACHWSVPASVIALRRHCTPGQAVDRLAQAGGSLRRALEVEV